MFAAVPTWSLLVLAGMAIVVRRWSGLLMLFGANSFRVDVVGERSDVASGVANGPCADYHRQLIDLGFEPLGVFRESMPGYNSDREYALVHPDLQCRATIYMLGGSPNVSLKSDMADGRLVRTCNCFGEVQDPDTADYIVRRRSTHSMQELLEVHQDARSSWVNDGAALILPRTIDELAEFETHSFVNSPVHLRCRSILINSMLAGLFYVVLFSAFSASVAFEFRGDVWRTFSVCLISFTGVGYLRHKMWLRGFRQKQEDERSAAQSSLDASVA